MRETKMQLFLKPSEIMNLRAERNRLEHDFIRLSKRARLHYRPSGGDTTYIKVEGVLENIKLKIGQAINEDLANEGMENTKTIGFVTTKTYNKIMGKIDKYKKIWVSEQVEKIMIGCDPEFILVNKDGTAEYGDDGLGYEFDDPAKKQAVLGSDGPCAEMRPPPSNNSKQLVENMKNIFETEGHKIENYDWVGGASFWHPDMDRRYYIGGHIHLGLPNIEGGAKHPDKMIQARIVRILDEFVALPLVRLDTPVASERRLKEKDYGCFGAMRSGDIKFEWRVPSGIWFVHPTLALVTIATTKAVVEEIWKKYEDNNYNKDFLMLVDNKNNIQRYFDCMDTEYVRNIVNNSSISDVPTSLVLSIHNKLKQMSTYPLYKSEIDGFIKICCRKQVPLKASQLDLKRGWLAGKSL